MTEETYTHGHHQSVLRSHRWRTVENSAAHLVGHLHPGQDVLDVGCGPGTITVDIARLVAPGLVVGMDASPDVIDQARAAVQDAGVDVRMEVGDAYATGAEDGSFDVVHAHQVLQHLGDPVRALIEWRRVVRPGGVVAARDADYASMSWWPLDPRLDQWLDLYRRAARANGGEPDAGRRLLAWANAAGFTDVTPSASAWCFADPADRAWWGSLWADRVTTSALAGQLVDAGMASVDELADIADAWHRWATSPDGWFCVPHGEVIARP